MSENNSNSNGHNTNGHKNGKRPLGAPIGNKNAAGNRGGGRKTSYNPGYIVLAQEIAKLGATDVDIAKCFQVSESTINAWKREHFEFAEALKRGKQVADALVEASLFHRATGYSHEAVKIFADPKTGAEKQVAYIEHYPPDTTACIFWLKNRRPAEWRDRAESVQVKDDTGELEQLLTSYMEGFPEMTREEAIQNLFKYGKIEQIKQLGQIG
jgi:hypothetical protein